MFIRKGCDDEDQTLLIENTIRNLDEDENKQANVFGKASKVIDKLMDKLEYQVEYQKGYQIPENLIQ